MRIEFFIPGDPVAKAGVKARWTGNRVVSNMPRKTVEYMNYVRNKILCSLQSEELPVFPKGTALKLTTSFFFLRPESVRKGKQYREHHTVKPDGDNCKKSIMDAMKSVIYYDDSQVCRWGEGGKYYTNDPREVGVYVVIEEVE